MNRDNPETTGTKGISLDNFTEREREHLRRTPAQLKSSLKRRFIMHWAVLVFFFLASAAVIASFGPRFEASLPWIFWLGIGIPLARHLRLLIYVPGVKVYKLEKAPKKWLPPFSPAEIRSLIEEAAMELGGVETPNIYISVDKTANASAINSMFANCFGRLNAIYLNTYILKALKKEELKAVLVHELAHFHRYISPLNRNEWVATLISTASIFLLFTLIPQLLFLTLITFAVYYWAAVPFLWLFHAFAYSTDRDLEYASDTIAAEIIGVLPMVNALLKLGDRAEIFEIMEEQLRRCLSANPKIDPSEVLEKLTARLPDRKISLKTARALLRQPVRIHNQECEENNNKKLIKTLLEKRRLRKALKVVRWNDFDTIQRDNTLDEKEFDNYVQKLLSIQHSATHSISTDHAHKEMLQNHPSIKKRIIYLYIHFVLNKPNPPSSDSRQGDAPSRAHARASD